MFKVVKDKIEIGLAEQLALDHGMGMAYGDFIPSAGYDAVRPIFRRLSDACAARDLEPLNTKDRDDLGLRLIGPDGSLLSSDWIMIYDYDLDIFQVEIKLLDRNELKRIWGDIDNK